MYIDVKHWREWTATSHVMFPIQLFLFIFLHVTDQAITKQNPSTNPTSVVIATEVRPSSLGVEKALKRSLNDAQAASLQQPVEDVHSKNEVTNLRKSVTLCSHLAEICLFSPSIKGPEKVTYTSQTSHRGASEVKFRKHCKLKSQTGNDDWKRWIQWQESQKNLYLVFCMFSCLYFLFCWPIFSSSQKKCNLNTKKRSM